MCGVGQKVILLMLVGFSLVKPFHSAPNPKLQLATQIRDFVGERKQSDGMVIYFLDEIFDRPHRAKPPGGVSPVCNCFSQCCSINSYEPCSCRCDYTCVIANF